MFLDNIKSELSYSVHSEDPENSSAVYKSPFTLTENGAITHATSGSECVNLFGTIGALRHSEPEEIRQRFSEAFRENKDIAVRIAFYARDVRGGLGERKVFREILSWLEKYSPDSIRKNIALIPEYGRFDDLLCLLKTSCEPEAISLIKSQLEQDINAENPSLLAKWLPSINASNSDVRELARIIAKNLGMNWKDYRQMLSELRKKLNLLENFMREEKYNAFDYSKQPSQAMRKHIKAFLRNDAERYNQFLQDVQSGKTELKTKTLMPYEIIMPFCNGTNLSPEEINALNITWNSQEDYTNGENAIVVADVSGSMSGQPMAVSVSLAIYFAERNKGKFANHFITFSQIPNLIEIHGGDIHEKVKLCMQADWGMNTDLQKVFELILKTAVKNKVPMSELPETIYIISDMEFDRCVNGSEITNFDYARKIFHQHGYILPRVVFWNVNSRNRQQPVTKNEAGVCLVSGLTARIFQLVASAQIEDFTPEKVMMEILNSERYVHIMA